MSAYSFFSDFTCGRSTIQAINWTTEKITVRCSKHKIEFIVSDADISPEFKLISKSSPLERILVYLLRSPYSGCGQCAREKSAINVAAYYRGDRDENIRNVLLDYLPSSLTDLVIAYRALEAPEISALYGFGRAVSGSWRVDNCMFPIILCNFMDPVSRMPILKLVENDSALWAFDMSVSADIILSSLIATENGDSIIRHLASRKYPVSADMIHEQLVQARYDREMKGVKDSKEKKRITAALNRYAQKATLTIFRAAIEAAPMNEHLQYAMLNSYWYTHDMDHAEVIKLMCFTVLKGQSKEYVERLVCAMRRFKRYELQGNCPWCQRTLAAHTVK